MAKYTIKFLPDYSSTSLWSASDNAYADLGIMLSYEQLGLSGALIERLEKFDDSVMDIIDWDDPAGESPLSFEERMNIYNEGQELLQLVRAELGEDFEVLDCNWTKPE